MRKLALAAAVLALGIAAGARVRERPADWAVPVKAAYLENFYQVDKKLYRCAQPSRNGFKEAKRLGITDILNLRDPHSGSAGAARLGLNLHTVKMDARGISEPEIVQALRIIHEAPGPVLVHCWHGSDRTGAVCAMYRIVFNGWSKEEAIVELVEGGFGYHKMYANIIRLIQHIDAQRVREQVLSPK
jgi:protein tyrosine/serine phosphatase